MFNLSKIITKMFGMQKSAARESDLEEVRRIQGLSSGEGVIQEALSVDRYDDDQPVMESNLDNSRTGGGDKILESSIDDHKGYTGRQEDKTSDYGDVSPMSVASESWDSSARNIYMKELAKMGKTESILDKYIGDRNNIELKRKSMPASGSGLANDPNRFTSFNGIPVADASKNMKNFKEKATIEKIASSLMDLDAMRFAIEYSAAKRGFRTEKEDVVLYNLAEEKKKLLSGILGV